MFSLSCLLKIKLFTTFPSIKKHEDQRRGANETKYVSLSAFFTFNTKSKKYSQDFPSIRKQKKRSEYDNHMTFVSQITLRSKKVNTSE